MKLSHHLGLTITFGLIYGSLWLAIVQLASLSGAVVPLSWIHAIVGAENLSDGTRILLIRLLWAVEFAVHVFAAAFVVGILVVKWYRNAAKLALLSIAGVALVSFAVAWYMSLPRYVPIYVSLPYVLLLFPIALYLAVATIKHITKASTGRGENSGPAKPGWLDGRAG